MTFTNNLLLRRSKKLPSIPSKSRIEVSERTKIGKVVLAESNAPDLDHFASILRNLGFTVLTAQEGKTAFTLVRRHLPLLVLSSLDLPGLDGYKLVQALRENKQTENIPFMFIVESGQIPDRVIGHQTFANDYIQKPISVPEFKSRVMGLLNLIKKQAGTPSGASVAQKAPDAPVGPRPERPKSLTSTDMILDESFQKNIEAMRGLLIQLSEFLSRLERPLQLSTALSEQVRGRVEQVEHGSQPGQDDSGSVLRFQSPKNGGQVGHFAESAAYAVEDENAYPEANSVNSARWSRSAPADARFTGARRELDRLKRYREEFREITRDLSGPRPDQQVLDSHERSVPGRYSPPSDGDLSSLDASLPKEKEIAAEELVEEASTTSVEQEDYSLDDLELDFDPNLLNKLGVDLGEPAVEKIKEEEFTSFARQSFLSAFLDEGERIRRVDSLYEESLDYVLKSIRRAAVGGNPYAPRAESLIQRVVASVRQSSELLVKATDRKQDFSVSAHSVNVAVLAIRIAQVLKRNHQFQWRVGLAALFHEIGVVRLPEKLVFEEKSLSEAELRTLRKRPLFSARVLEEHFGAVSEIVGQVFEREDGSGFPLGLKGGEIREEAKIIGVADFFEACIHKRPYRGPLSGYQTLYELSKDGEFYQESVRALIQAVSLFPFNEILLLSTGEVARVVEINKAHLSRPRVRVICDSDGRPVEGGREIDLSVDSSVSVAEVQTTDTLAKGRGE